MKIEVNIDQKLIDAQASHKYISFTKSIDILRDKINERASAKKPHYPTQVLDNKLIGNEFARQCGLKTSEVNQCWASIDSIEFRDNTVLKPVSASSSRGVFIIYSKDNIIYLNRNLKFDSPFKAKQYALNLIKKKEVIRDRWMTESLLYNENSIARDIKFYNFYGKTGLILETQRIGKIKRCWFDADLNYVDTGKYQKNLFKASRDGIDRLKKIAERISLEIPAPFVRIDFLLTNNEIFFGEFTPVPANYDAFNRKWDLYLGELFLEASLELSYDISMGKSFDKFLRLEKNWDNILTLTRERAKQFF